MKPGRQVDNIPRIGMSGPPTLTHASVRPGPLRAPNPLPEERCVAGAALRLHRVSRTPPDERVDPLGVAARTATSPIPITIQTAWDRDGADAASGAHLRNVISVTPVTPRGDGLWSSDAHAIAVGAGVRGTGPSTHHVPVHDQ